MQSTMTSTPSPFSFHVRSRLGIVWDLAMVGICVAMVFAFLAQVWSAPTPVALRTLGATTISARTA